LRPALVDLLPPAFGAATAGTSSTGRARRLSLGCAAALLGVITHLVWDGLTHENGWIVGAVSALRTDLARPASGDLRWFNVLQHVSTVGGTLFVFAWMGRAWAGLPDEARRFGPGQVARTTLVAGSLALAAAVAGVLNGRRAWSGPPLATIAFAAVGAMVGLLLVAAMFGAVVQVRAALRRRRQTSKK
jgi:hypothetical protein